MKTLSAVIAVMALIFAWTDMHTQASGASVPPLVNYQGMLTDTSGSPMTGTRKLTFNIYDAATGGNAVWGPQVFEGVPLISGRFNVILGTTDTAGRLITNAFNAKDRYLGIKVDANAEIAPRQQILSTPFAIQAEKAAYASNGIPAGTVLAYGGSSLPAGFLECNGAEVSRTTYAALFSAIGISWGSGNGTSTFHLPDLRGRFPRGLDGGAGRDTDAASRTASNSGGNTGDKVGSVQEDEFKMHKHKTSVDESNVWILGSGGFISGAAGFSNIVKFGMDNVGGSETRPKNAYVKYLIKY